MTEVVPLAVSGLIPIALFPLFGIEDASIVCLLYMSVNNWNKISGVFRISKRGGPNVRWPLVLTKKGEPSFPIFLLSKKNLFGQRCHGQGRVDYCVFFIMLF